MTITSALFGMLSVFYAGLYRAKHSRRHKRPMIVIIRMFIAVLIAINSLAEFVIAFWMFRQRPYAVVTSELVTVLSWCCHAVSLWIFSTSLAYNGRGPLLLNSCWYLTFIASILHFHSVIRWTQHPTQYQHTAPSDMYFTLLSRLTTYIHMGLQILYGISFIFSVSPDKDSISQNQSVQSSDRYSRQVGKETSIQSTIDTNSSAEDEEDVLVREKQPLLNTSQGNRSTNYGGLATGSHKDNDNISNAYEDSANCFSLLLFWWVWPLLRRGAMGYLETITDLPPLPRFLKTSYIRTKFKNVLLKKLQARPDTNVRKQNEHSEREKETPTGASKDHEALIESEVMLRSVTRSTPTPIHTPTPESITTNTSNSTGKQSTDNKKDAAGSDDESTSLLFLFSAINSAFGWHYYPLGLLKLITDLLGFAGPLLLYQLVSFIENKKVS